MPRVTMHITGIVQGVGMRPFIYREAVAHGIRGWVLNAGDGVHIEATASERALELFTQALRDHAPVAARIDAIEVSAVDEGECVNDERADDAYACDRPDGCERNRLFVIRASDDGAERTTLVSPDIATCPDCLRELFDPSDRRYRYPFINCTNCGPRFTIIRSLPYDRASTSMDAFPLCDACAAEYRDPSDRRFHAQPNACFACGPHISWRARDDEAPLWGISREKSDAIVERCADILAAGGIVAIKGLGGFHLACNATDEVVVAELRRRKRRPRKPLAIMVASLDIAEQLCQVSAGERELLTGSIRPIVLLQRNSDETPAARRTSSTDAPLRKAAPAAIAPSVAFDLPEIGVMLPYTPLQHLLLAACRARGVTALVMTSGNISGEPIEIDDARAWTRLVAGGIADALLGNDRPILSRFDDSVVRVIGGTALPVRRARGYAPQPVALRSHDAAAPCILACGAEQKATLAYTRAETDGSAQCFLSPHIGDVEHGEALDCWHETRARMAALFDLAPQAIACDLHPQYLVSQWARAEAMRETLPLIEVQHHHAHIVASMAEAMQRGGLSAEQPAIGIAFDGTGMGTDGTIWGGEILIAHLTGYARAAHLEPWPLPGGAAAVRDPRRCAYGLLAKLDLLEHPGAAHLRSSFSTAERATLATMVERNLNCPHTSSMGRLLDALAAILGICDAATYEGEPAIELEATARHGAMHARARSVRGSRAGGAQATRRAQDVSLAEYRPRKAYRFDYRWHDATRPDDATRARQMRVGELSAREFLPRDRQCAIDMKPLVSAALDDIASGRDVAAVALDIHASVTQLILDIACNLREKTSITDVALGGGVFMNRLILEGTCAALASHGFTVHMAHAMPLNDGGLAYGQAAVACARLAR